MQGNLLVEEKEQNTWRILKQQGVSLSHLVIAKASLTAIVTLGISFITGIASGFGLFTSFLVCVFIIPALLIMLSIGTIVSLYSRNTIEVNLWATPVVIVFIALEIINQVLSNQGETVFIQILPNYLLYEGLSLIPTRPADAFLFPFLYNVVLSFLFIFIALFTMNKRKTDF